MKYSMYNVVWYDGVDAYVSKFILKTDEEQAEKDISDFWSIKGYDGVILKIDMLYTVNFENIISLKNGTNEDCNTFKCFNEMYF